MTATWGIRGNGVPQRDLTPARYLWLRGKWHRWAAPECPARPRVHPDPAEDGPQLELSALSVKRGNPRSVGGAVLVEWMLPGGHGSADPGLGMNRPPERLSLSRLWFWLCSCRLRARGELHCVLPSGPGEAPPGTGPRADGRGRM